MSYSLKILNSGISIFCWLVRGGCVAILLLVLAIFIGEGPPNPFKLTSRELLLMFWFLATLVGLALALWRQLLGGIIVLVSITGFTIVAGVQENWLFYALWLMGLLNIFCWWFRRLQGNKK